MRDTATERCSAPSGSASCRSHAVVIVDGDRRIQGLITQAHLLAALARGCRRRGQKAIDLTEAG